MATEPSALRATTSMPKAVPARLVYSRPVTGWESAADAALLVLSTQLKSLTQLATTKVQAVELPKRQVVGPASAGVLMVLKVVVPTDGKLIGLMLTELLPAGMVNAPRLGMEAGLPVAISVPVAAAEV